MNSSCVISFNARSINSLPSFIKLSFSSAIDEFIISFGFIVKNPCILNKVFFSPFLESHIPITFILASLAALTIYACALKAKEAMEAWFNEVAYPLLDFGYNIASGLVENTVSAVFSNESDCMLCGTKDAVYSFATRAYSGAANVSAAIMEGVGE